MFFSEVLSSVHTDVDIQSCPVFQTPPPTIVSQQSAAPQPLGAEYVTGGSTSTTTSTFIILLSTTLLPLLLQLWVVQQSWSKGLWSQVTRKSYHTQMQIADKSVFSVISPTANPTKEAAVERNNKNGSCSFEEVLFTAHYNDISRELRINEQQINKKAESESETCPNATNALISCCSQSS